MNLIALHSISRHRIIKTANCKPLQNMWPHQKQNRPINQKLISNRKKDLPYFQWSITVPASLKCTKTREHGLIWSMTKFLANKTLTCPSKTQRSPTRTTLFPTWTTPTTWVSPLRKLAIRPKPNDTLSKRAASRWPACQQLWAKTLMIETPWEIWQKKKKWSYIQWSKPGMEPSSETTIWSNAKVCSALSMGITCKRRRIRCCPSKKSKTSRTGSLLCKRNPQCAPQKCSMKKQFISTAVLKSTLKTSWTQLWGSSQQSLA